MSPTLAQTQNMKALMVGYDELKQRAAGTPGMGLIYGFTGAGKTTATCWLINKQNAVYVRALAMWSGQSMLQEICREIGIEPQGSPSRMLPLIIERFALTGRALFVDEADYLFHNPRLLETLRDIHDQSLCPVVLIGMEGIDRKILRHKQLARRISQWIEFKPLDLDDLTKVAAAVCPVQVAPDLLQNLHQVSKGSIGLSVVGLAQIAKAGKGRETPMDLGSWGDREFFLGGRVV